jgi:GAF domain-containing protein
MARRHDTLESGNIRVPRTGGHTGPAVGRPAGTTSGGGVAVTEHTGYELPTWAPLPARPDVVFDELAARVAAELQVRRALVVLVSKGGQVIPGAYGLPEPWASRRSMPLAHSMSLGVTSTGEPLVLQDARTDPELGSRPAVRESEVVSYAAMPLQDVHGRPIGSLAVSDDRPRAWSPTELATLRRLAGEASRRLQFHAVELAEQEAEAASRRDGIAAQQAAEDARAALAEAEAAADRARLVARLSAELIGVETLPDVLRTVDRQLRSRLGAAVTLLGLAESGCPDLRVWTTVAGGAPSDSGATALPLDDAHPLAIAVRERRAVPLACRTAAEAEFPGLARLPVGVETTVSVPIVLGQHTAAAGLLVGWQHGREIDAPLERTIVDLARHLGHALDRVLLRDQRLRLATDAPELRHTA